MKKIMPVFKDEKDKVVAVAMIIASMFLVFIPALLVVLFGKSYVSESTYEISKAFFNFELLLNSPDPFIHVPEKHRRAVKKFPGKFAQTSCVGAAFVL